MEADVGQVIGHADPDVVDIENIFEDRQLIDPEWVDFLIKLVDSVKHLDIGAFPMADVVVGDSFCHLLGLQRN